MRKRVIITYERTEQTAAEAARWASDTTQPNDEHDEATRRDHERIEAEKRKLQQQGFTAHVGRRS